MVQDFNPLCNRLDGQEPPMRKTFRHVLNRVTHIATHTEREAVTGELCTLVRDAAGCRWTLILLLDHEEHQLHFADCCGLAPREIMALKKRPLPLVAFPLARRLSRRSHPLPVAIHDITPLCGAQTPALTADCSLTAFPLLVKGQLQGILITARPLSLPPFTKSEIALLQHLISHAALTLSHLAIQNQLLEVALETARQYEEMHEVFIGTVASLANAIDAKSSWTKGHSERVMHLSLRLAREMGLGSEETERLRIAALLHDVGKIGIIEALLEKPARLSDEEFPPMRLHPAKGVAILAPIKRLRDILPGILHHHERFDGSGYPAGMKGEQIPLPARIIAVADAYDAMVSGRPYKKGCPSSEALAELERCAGSQFDPRVVQCFTAAMSRRKTPQRRKSPCSEP
jgi:hypothetical protein